MRKYFKKIMTYTLAAGILAGSVMYAAPVEAAGHYRTVNGQQIFYQDGKRANWWYDDGTAWYFFKNGRKLTGYAKDNAGNHRFINGKYATGYQKHKDTYRFYDPDGRLANWWYDDGTAWYFFKNGRKLTGYAKDNAGNHRFINGKYATGYQKHKDTYRFYDPDGRLANWWYDDGTAWFFFKNGRKLTGHGKDNAGEHYFVDGDYATGYHKVNGNRKFYDPDGRLANWWYDDGTAWFFFQKGVKHTGYAKDNAGRHYFVNGIYAEEPVKPAKPAKPKSEKPVIKKQAEKKSVKKPAASIEKPATTAKKPEATAKTPAKEVRPAATGYRTVGKEQLFYVDSRPADWWYDDGTAWFFFKGGRKCNGIAKDNAGEHLFENGQYVQGWASEGKNSFFYKDGVKFTGIANDGNAVREFKDGKIVIQNKFKNYEKVQGDYVVDISEHNGDIDFEKLKKNVDGVIIRLSWGNFAMDLRAMENIRKAQEYKIPFGVYHYSYALDMKTLNSEADNVIRVLTVNGIKPELPVFFDMEDADYYKANNGLNYITHAGLFTDMCRTFCAKVHQAGFEAGVYASKSWFDAMGDLTDYHIWLAHWGIPAPSMENVSLWQYTADGNGKAIGTAGRYVDENLSYIRRGRNVK